MGRKTFRAVIFDLDGVVTKTALIHAQAWKFAFDEYLRIREERDKEPFREFTHEADYLPYVDGKPRYDGVKNFLESRGINIPFGDPGDPPEKETVCGIGNKKNDKFLDILKKNGAEVYPSTIELIKRLKAAGVRIGVASSSKNCKLILEATGIEDLFETRVDGLVSVELGLKGKPEGDIFVRAAHNLGMLPAVSVVVEDATSGVMAGRNGGFGLVIGIARKDNVSSLLKNGADVVVRDLSDMSLDWMEEWFVRRPRPLFKSWQAYKDRPLACGKGKIAQDKQFINPCYSQSAEAVFLKAEKIVFFLDYDGTLTPIVKRPEQALISQEMRGLLKRLSEKHTVSIVSGRTREDVQRLVGLDGFIFAGSHGFDISTPERSMIEPRAKAATQEISKVAQSLKNSIGSIPGVLIEDKKFSVAVHYRLVKEDALGKIKEMVQAVVNNHKTLRIMSGKKVFELLPDIDWDKGRAIRWIMQVLELSWSDVPVVYIGDDVTDEDAFRVVRTRGTGVLVSKDSKVSAADFHISSTDDVKTFLEKIIKSS